MRGAIKMERKLKYDSLYDEIYALMSLELAFPGYSVNMLKSESPDWQDYVSNIGLEISRADNKITGKVQFLLNKYRGKTGNGISDTGTHLIHYGEDRRFIAVSHDINGNKYIDLAVEAVEKKLSKLNKYRSAEENELYLFSGMDGGEVDIKTFIQKYIGAEQKRNYSRRFYKIYIFDNDALYTITTNDFSYQRYLLSHEELSRLKSCALHMRETIEWENGTSFYDMLISTDFSIYLTEMRETLRLKSSQRGR